ncbi:MAG: large ribosomal subunit protein uL22 [Patescibacteria group bacterium]
MEYQATAKYLRFSPRKALLVADSIRHLTPEAALVALANLPKAAAKPLIKVITSALANAKQKGIGTETLRFKTIEVMSAPALRRFRAVSRGMAHTYKKRMTHIRVVLIAKEVNSQEGDYGAKN